MDIERIDSEGNDRKDYELYQKPTRKKGTILANATMSAKDKRTMLTQDCIRRYPQEQDGVSSPGGPDWLPHAQG